jgi:hypothetical protein
MAVLTTQPQEAFLQTPALEVGLELLLHEIRERAATFSAHLPKCRIVLLDQLIQQRRIGLARTLPCGVSTARA